MKGLSKIFIAAIAVFVIALLALQILFVRIHPWEFGVKQNLLAKEIVEKDFGTGFALRIPGLHQWHRVDRRTHFVTFADQDVRTALGTNKPALEIRTKDNNLATYDLSVTYKIIEGRSPIAMAGSRAPSRPAATSSPTT